MISSLCKITENVSFKELRFAYRCVNGCNPSPEFEAYQGHAILDSLDQIVGYLFTYWHDTESGWEMEIMDFGLMGRRHVANHKMGRILKNIIETVIADGHWVVAAVNKADFARQTSLAIAGLHEFDPDELWAGPDFKYYIEGA